MIRTKRFLIFLIFIVLVILAGIATYVYTQRIKPMVERELKAFIEKSTQNLYKVEFSKLSFNLWTGSAYITDIKFYPDTQAYQQQIADQTAPNNLYYIQLEKLSVERFRPLQMYYNREAKISRIKFEHPQIEMVNRQFAFNDIVPPQPRKSPYTYISKFFNSLHVEEILFENASVKYINKNRAIPEIDSVNKLNVKLKDWLIDPNSATDPERIYLLKDVHVGLDDYTFATPDSMYLVKVKQLDFALKAGQLQVKQFGLEPRFSAFEFGVRSGYARDRFAVHLNDLKVHGIDLHAYISKQQFLAKKMHILDGDVHVQNDNRFPKKDQDRTGRFPHQLLQKLEAKIRVDSIELENIDISYTEFDRDSKQNGRISFENTKGTLMHVGNMDPNKIMAAQLESYVMGQGKLVVNFQFDKFDPKGAFTYKGKLTNLDAKTLNQITKPLGMIQINRAEIKELAFDIKANSDRALGTVDFRYNNLSVALMKKEAGKERLVRQGWLSFLANNLVLYSDNPSAEGHYTQAQINYQRQPTASFFNFIWRTLFQGVKYSVGVTPAREREIKKQISRFEQLKEDREERKIKREIRKSRRP